ncbi:MAG: hypothetical protein NW223_17330 [Hyphomicrobiaceae bacterium]|nr:hypothetical protein [Hyphomicrobiaceae bacterium]
MPMLDFLAQGGWYDYLTTRKNPERKAMDAGHVRKELITILGQIQAMSGLACPALTGASVPITDLDKFDSKIWPVATGMLAATLNVEIPNNVNIFSTRGACRTPLSIDQAVAEVCRVASSATPVAAE